MSARKKESPVPGHKRAHVSFGVCVECECGWRSVTVFGKGASADAHAQWRNHARAHQPMETKR